MKKSSVYPQKGTFKSLSNGGDVAKYTPNKGKAYTTFSKGKKGGY